MTPQTINAYYNPELNEIVFPAAILQPPFFNPNADDAVNYGAIGMVIGHEISHGFDDQGAQYDGDGNLRDWWTKEDHEKFAAKTQALVAEYDAFEPVPGYHVNGELTLGENIADNSGLAVAYKAYQIVARRQAGAGDRRLHRRPALLHGLRAGVAREVCATTTRSSSIKSDPHSIPIDRVLGTVVNQPAFYTAFDVKQGDKMYVAPEQRVTSGRRAPTLSPLPLAGEGRVRARVERRSGLPSPRPRLRAGEANVSASGRGDSLDAIRDRLHHATREPHQRRHRLRQRFAHRRAARCPRAAPRRPSSPHDRAAARIVLRQAFEMLAEMRLDLAFGLDDEAETQPIADECPPPTPIAYAPAYQSGFSRLGRLSSSRRRSPHHAR